jgi:Rieske 2Fe-2S family protein
MATSYVNTRPELDVETRTLPARYYTDPELFRRELAAIHHDMWLAAGREDQVPTPGSYFLRQVGDASVVVLRDDHGALRAFHNVCRHRGTMLCKPGQEQGRFAGRIQCGYHAWTYGLDGRLIAAPQMDKVSGFREQDFPLRSVHTATWDGHVFINLSERPIPLERHLGGLDRKFRPWGMKALKTVERRVYRLKANWKLIIQNYSECVHCPVAHPQLSRQSHFMSGENEAPQPGYLGGHMELREGVQSLTLDGKSNREALPGLSPEERRRVYYYAILPNLLLNLHPDYMLTFTIWPLAADRSDVICEWHFHPDEIARPDFDPRGAVELWDLTNRQDWELSDLAQLGIGSRGYVPGPYSNREELLLALDRWVIGKLATGPGER